MPLSRRGGYESVELPRLEGEFLEDVSTVRAFVTLTLTNKGSRLKLDDLFCRWTQMVQKHNRMTLGWIKAVEPFPQRHLHIVLFSGGALDCCHAEDLWRKIVAPRYLEAARVEPYIRGIGGVAYILKSLGRDYEDVQFSPNLTAFYLDASSRFFGLTAAERRQIRRIKKQTGHALDAAEREESSQHQIY